MSVRVRTVRRAARAAPAPEAGPAEPIAAPHAEPHAEPRAARTGAHAALPAPPPVAAPAPAVEDLFGPPGAAVTPAPPVVDPLRRGHRAVASPAGPIVTTPPGGFPPAEQFDALFTDAPADPFRAGAPAAPPVTPERPARRERARKRPGGPPRPPWFGAGGRIQPPRRAVVAGSLVVLLALVGGAVAVGRWSNSRESELAHSSETSATASATAAAPTPTPSPTGDGLKHTGAAAKVKLGIFRNTSPSQVRAFESWLGRDSDYVVDFSNLDSWKMISQPDYMIDAWKGTRYRMVYSVAMLPRPSKNPGVSMAKGAKGDYDQYYRTLAQRLVAAGQQKSIIRIGWEFNLGTSYWSTKSPTDFIRYWRHIVTAMRSVDGQKFQFDWNFNVGETTYDATHYYPGDRYVDYIGVDAYDISFQKNTYPYPASCDDACRLRRQKAVWDRIYNGPFGLIFWSDYAKDKGKPLSLPEWGLWERDDGHGGGDNPYFIKQMFAFIDDPQNNVAYQAYFDSDAHNGEHRLTQLPAAGEEFRSLFG